MSNRGTELQLSAMKVVNAMPGVPGMTKPEIDNFLAQTRSILRIATLDHKGRPQIHPVWFHFEGDRIYLMTDKSTRKLANIRRNNLVYFSIDTDAPPNRGVKGRGTAHMVKETQKALPIAEKIVTKYLGDASTGMGKGLVDAARAGSELVIEIKPSYYSVWDYGKMKF